MKKLTMKDVFTREAYEYLTAIDRRRILKLEQAKEYSGLRRYPSTCAAVFARIPAEWLDKYTAEHVGEIAKMLKSAYDDGKNA